MAEVDAGLRGDVFETLRRGARQQREERGGKRRRADSGKCAAQLLYFQMRRLAMRFMVGAWAVCAAWAGEISGVVVADDGMPFLAPVEVRLHCAGSETASTAADGVGRFRFPAGQATDACELSASAAGYRVSRTPVRGLPAAAGIPALVLRRAGKYQGETISVSHLAALPVARAQFQLAARKLFANEIAVAAVFLRLASRSTRGMPPPGSSWAACAWRSTMPTALAKRLPGAVAADPWFLAPYEPLLLLERAEGNAEAVWDFCEKLRRINPHRRTDARRASSFAPRAQLFAAAFLAVSAGGQTLELSVGGLDIAAIPPTPRNGRGRGFRRLEDGRGRAVRAAQDKPGDAGLLRALAVAHFQAGRWFAAARAFKRSDRIEPLRAADRFALATAFSRLERRHWARAELERLVEEHPAEKDYRFALSEIFYFYQWFEQAANSLRRLSGLRPALRPRTTAWASASKAWAGTRKPPRLTCGRSNWTKHRAGNRPGPPFIWAACGTTWGCSQKRKRRWSGRPSSVRRRPPSITSSASCCASSGSGRQAAESLERAVSLEPENAQALPALAQVYRRMGAETAARQTLERFREMQTQTGQ